MGGASIGFHRAGFECIGVDAVDIAYPYELVLADARTWHPGKRYDVVWLSPVCTEWSSLTRLAIARGQRGQPDIEGALELVEGCLRIKDEADPAFWILENVAGGEKYIEPILGKPKIRRGPWRLWGEFPPFLLPESPKAMRKTGGEIGGKRYHKDMGSHDGLNSVFAFNPLRSWFRAKIPIPLSVPMGKACMDALRLEAVA